LPHHLATIYCKRKGEGTTPSWYAISRELLQDFTLFANIMPKKRKCFDFGVGFSENSQISNDRSETILG